MKCFHDFSLRALNTLAFASRAERFTQVESDQELLTFLQQRRRSDPLLVLGGGSNLVLRERLPGDVLQLVSKGIDQLSMDDESVLIEAQAGEHWDSFVAYCSSRGWYGLENLSLIPGTVGAAPIQNIGAYGVELDQLCDSVRVADLEDGTCQRILASECGFAYRDSHFKSAWRDRFVVLSVRFKLQREFQPCLTHQDLQRWSEAQVVSPEKLRREIIQIRQQKLPDPLKIPNAGSFFKNCLVDEVKFTELQKANPSMPYYPMPDKCYKIPSAWLIDSLGWKGYRNEHVGVHDRQALVLINHSEGRGDDILSLANAIQESVAERYDLALEIEPVVYGANPID